MSSARAASGLNVVCKTGSALAECVPNRPTAAAAATMLVRTKPRRDKSLFFVFRNLACITSGVCNSSTSSSQFSSPRIILVENHLENFTEGSLRMKHGRYLIAVFVIAVLVMSVSAQDKKPPSAQAIQFAQQTSDLLLAT